jgi:hypothetical protein
MIKLTLLSSDGYRHLMSDLDSTATVNNAVLGYIETLDGSNQWKVNPNKMAVATNPAWYRLLFMKQPGEIPYAPLSSLALTTRNADSNSSTYVLPYNTVKGVITLPSNASEDTYVNLFAKPLSGDMSSTMSLPPFYYAPRGQNTVEFSEIFPGVKQPTTYELTALSGNEKVGTFTVNPPSLSDFSLLSETPHSTGGSQLTMGTESIKQIRIYLDSCAPVGGLKVDMTSSDPTAISVPASVTFDAGHAMATITPQKGANFKAGASVKLTAHYAGFTDVTKTLDFQFVTGISVKVLGSVRSSKETMRVNPSVSHLGQIQNRQNVSNFSRTGSAFIHQ